MLHNEYRYPANGRFKICAKIQKNIYIAVIIIELYIFSLFRPKHLLFLIFKKFFLQLL